ncbi:MAG: cytochrome c3 family protein [Bacteroidia bacterium]|nr:cytochrome c3 family protein [Bacteroidia bacterium]
MKILYEKCPNATSGLITAFLVFSFFAAWSQNNSGTVRKFENKEDNSKCFKCHFNNNYTVTSPDSSKIITRKMYMDLQIDSNVYYHSNHRYFKCIDCHSDEYFTYPHNNDLRFEDISTCLDCHGGDPKFEKFNFEKITEDFKYNVHSEKHNSTFSCWSCHDPHTYTTHARTDKNILEVVAYDNNLCLQCHANKRNYRLIIDKDNPNLVQKHDWLPNQALHFKNVRCIECHTKKSDTLLVSHHVMEKKDAVRACVECHSRNSLLMATLYKYQSKEEISRNGFLNSIILNRSYVIGANRNYYLNMISLAILYMVISGIIIHALLRVKAYKRYHGK